MPWARAARRISDPLAWHVLPRPARLYVVIVTVVGAAGLMLSVPRHAPDPILFALLLLLACVTSSWKVTLPLSLSSGATLSVSYAADLMTLLLLGPDVAVLVAVAGAWMQCT